MTEADKVGVTCPSQIDLSPEFTALLISAQLQIGAITLKVSTHPFPLSAVIVISVPVGIFIIEFPTIEPIAGTLVIILPPATVKSTV